MRTFLLKKGLYKSALAQIRAGDAARDAPAPAGVQRPTHVVPAVGTQQLKTNETRFANADEAAMAGVARVAASATAC
jgi:hypothetical protein